MSFLFHNSKIVYAAMQELSDKLFVASAGNSDEDGIPVNLDRAPPNKKFYPASWALPNKIAVAATDENSKLADFSNYGKNTVPIAAPGAKVTSCSLKGEYVRMKGTSMASPLVAGTAQLLFAMKRNLSVAQVEVFIFQGATSASALKYQINDGLILNVRNSVELLYNAIKNKNP